MKKSYCISAICGIALLASCSSGEETMQSRQDGDRVAFGSYVDMPTRALDKSYFSTGDELCINAFQSSASTLNHDFVNNFMENETLSKTADGWTYVNSKFWPMNANDRISFVASYPNIHPSIAGGVCTFPFSVNATPALQQDFMWSTITDAHRNDRNGTHQNGVLEEPNTTPLNNVVLHFRHALSRIVFNAKTVTYYSGATITITDIIVRNLYGQGEYSLTSDLGKGSWALSGAQDNAYTPLSGGTSNAIDTRYKTFGTSLLVLPQKLNTTAGHESTVTIRYTVNYHNPSKVVNEERTFNLATASLLNGDTWEQDKVYNYNFNIALDMITFDAVVDSWGGSEDFGMTVE